MIYKTKEFYGSKLAAADGEIGHLKDFYFDDVTWAIRYLVADTGSWLTGRPVLFSASALGKLDPDENTLQVNLNKKQIQSSTTLGSNSPFAAPAETGCCRYYGWPAYWESGAKKDLPDQPEIQSSPPPKTENRVVYRHMGDKRLQSTQAVTDYQIQTVDGVIGALSGFMVDDKSWTIREIIVETGHWFSGKEIRIVPAQITQINSENFTVTVNLTKEDIQRSADQLVADTDAGFQ